MAGRMVGTVTGAAFMREQRAKQAKRALLVRLENDPRTRNLAHSVETRFAYVDRTLRAALYGCCCRRHCYWYHYARCAAAATTTKLRLPPPSPHLSRYLTAPEADGGGDGPSRQWQDDADWIDAGGDPSAPVPNRVAFRSRELANNVHFGNFVILCIVAAGMVVGVQTYEEHSENPVVLAVDYAILGVFSFEVILKMVAEGRRPWIFFVGPEWKWCVCAPHRPAPPLSTSLTRAPAGTTSTSSSWWRASPSASTLTCRSCGSCGSFASPKSSNASRSFK
jgi:hypothetical protein